MNAKEGFWTFFIVFLISAILGALIYFMSPTDIYEMQSEGSAPENIEELVAAEVKQKLADSYDAYLSGSLNNMLDLKKFINDNRKWAYDRYIEQRQVYVGKTPPHYSCFILAGISTISILGALMCRVSNSRLYTAIVGYWNTKKQTKEKEFAELKKALEKFNKIYDGLP